MACALGDDMSDAAEELVGQELMEYVPPAWRDNYSAEVSEMGNAAVCLASIIDAMALPTDDIGANPLRPSPSHLQEWAEKVLTHRETSLDTEPEELQIAY